MTPKLRTIRRILLVVGILILGITAVATLADSGTAATLDGKTAVHILDVGQGDSILLVSGMQAALIDAGTPEAGDGIVEYLRNVGVQELYAVVATHPHADHIGSMAEVIDEFPISHFYLGPETANTEVYGYMLDSLEECAVTPVIPTDGETLRFDSGATLTFLGPADDVPDDNLNNRSLICRFDMNGKSMLLMGDAEQEAENSLLLHHPELSCDFLKVGHHGGATSSTPAFLKAVHPSAAAISCGADNDYGHPSPEVLENLSNAGVTDVRVTAESGTVVFPFE